MHLEHLVLCCGTRAIWSSDILYGSCRSCTWILVFNANPAKVFMGDTGSLALGGAIAAVAILLKQELLLVIIGGVFVMETLSVIIQVISFKTTGKRVFKMSPLHHHYELCGWSEWRVVVTFWSVGFLLAVLGIYIGVWM